MSKEKVTVLGFEVEVMPEAVNIFLKDQPDPMEAKFICDKICTYLCEEGFFDKDSLIKVRIIKK